jgi:hypothetical protein
MGGPAPGNCAEIEGGGMNPEEQIHRAIVKYLRLAWPEILFFHPANGEKRGIQAAVRLKAMGVIPGVPDLVLIFPDGSHGYLEIKPEEKYATPVQKAFHAELTARNVKVAVVRSIEDVAQTLEEWI